MGEPDSGGDGGVADGAFFDATVAPAVVTVADGDVLPGQVFQLPQQAWLVAFDGQDLVAAAGRYVVGVGFWVWSASAVTTMPVRSIPA
ncbi:MAG: hypothetical protein ACRC0L_00380, partial [Angustibacter sp.]